MFHPSVTDGYDMKQPTKHQEQCSHEWMDYKQCCYCGAYYSHTGEILDMTKSPQYPVKKLAEDFQQWYFGVKETNGGRPPLAMQIMYWFSKRIDPFFNKKDFIIEQAKKFSHFESGTDQTGYIYITQLEELLSMEPNDEAGNPISESDE